MSNVRRALTALVPQMPKDLIASEAARDGLVFRAGARFRLGSVISKDLHDALASALWTFLKSNGLLSPAGESLNPTADWDSFELRRSHLTLEGWSVVREGLHKWLQAIDRGTALSRASSLARALARVRNPGSSAPH